MKRTSTFAAVLLGLMAVTTACERSDVARDPGAPAPSSTARVETRSDEAIQTEVQARFFTNDNTRGQRLDIAADDGVVTIRGAVADEAARSRAIELARSVEGVTQVKDEITVRPADAAETRASTPERDDPSMPSMITAKIQAQYFIDPDVKARKIDVTTVAGGVVTLEGTVDSAAAEAEALRIARATDGVTRVENRLRVESAPPRAEERRSATDSEPAQADGWLTTKIEAKYFLDPDVRGRNIDVETRDGMVTLTGVVGTEAERRQAVALARSTDGTREVTDKLEVDPALDPNARQVRSVANLDRPDGWITMKIQAQYFLDNDVKGHEIDVDTTKGIVTLTGVVDNAQQRQEAELIAKETQGVSQVVNRIKVEAE